MESASFEVITKDIAEEMLSHNLHNRKIRRSRVNYFKNMLMRGEMITTGQGITFYDNGEMGDGQHRVTAIYETGIPARLLVCRGVNPNAYAVTDDVCPRNITDRSDFSQNMAAIIRTYKILFEIANSRQFTVSEYIETYNKNKAGFDLAEELKTQDKKIGLAVIWACIARYASRDINKAREFAMDFRKTVPELNQTRVLQSIVLRSTNSHSYEDKKKIAGYCFSAMRAHMECREISRIGAVNNLDVF